MIDEFQKALLMTVEEERCGVEDGATFVMMMAMMLLFAVLLAAGFTAGLYWLMSYVRESDVRKDQAQQRALYVQNEAWTRMNDERKIWTEERRTTQLQFSALHAWLVQVVRSTQPRTDEERQWAKDANLQLTHTLDELKEMMGLKDHSKTRGEDTQKTPLVNEQA